MGEEDTFWTFTMLMEQVLPNDYYIQLMGIRADVELFGGELLE